MAARKQNRRRKRSAQRPGDASAATVGLRIVGGRFRGRKLLYHGDPSVRPMKDRLREAVFNLVGPCVRGTRAVDLFAGTGALALEALSRGAAQATLIERHLPTIALIRRNIEILGVESLCELVADDVFEWVQQGTPRDDLPWVVFCSPPYDFYVERTDAVLHLLGRLIESALPQSVFVVESDARFDFGRLPEADTWRVRRYRPATVGIWRKTTQTD